MVVERLCDVCKTVEVVKKYRITVDEVQRETHNALERISDHFVYLCPEALGWLEQKIAEGITPPSPRRDATKDDGGPTNVDVQADLLRKAFDEYWETFRRKTGSARWLAFQTFQHGVQYEEDRWADVILAERSKGAADSRGSPSPSSSNSPHPLPTGNEHAIEQWKEACPVDFDGFFVSWDEVIEACGGGDYGCSPIELIHGLVNAKDEAEAALAEGSKGDE